MVMMISPERSSVIKKIVVVQSFILLAAISHGPLSCHVTCHDGTVIMSRFLMWQCLRHVCRELMRAVGGASTDFNENGVHDS